MEDKIFVLSDIHLEGKSGQSQMFILKTINSLLANEKQKGISPILAITGDVHNGDSGIDWLNQIEAPIIYIGGNHEYWKNDYYETIDKLKNAKSSNVNFLHNDCIELGGHIFVGSTMWTDVGLSLNPDLMYKSNEVMNDRYEITANKWYDNEKNKETLLKYFPLTAANMIEKKQWNVLIEIEENRKTINYLNNFGLLIDILKEAKKELKTLNDRKDYKSSFQQSIDFLEEYKLKKNTLSSYKEKTFNQWFNDCKSIGLFREQINHPINFSNIEEIEIIFNKVKKMNINNPIVVVSHHLPFIEERLIGKQDWSKNYTHGLYNKFKEESYYITKGLHYPDSNYFYNINKGYYNKDESITHVIHYSNNGAKNLNNYFLKNVHSWLHGHEHHYNYQDFLRGINIATNPLGHSMAVFMLDGDTVKLNAAYKSHHKVSEENEGKEIQELLNSFLRPVVTKYTNTEEKEDLVKFWVLKNMDWDKYNHFYNNLTILNKKLLTYLIKRPQIALGKYTAKDQIEIQTFTDAIDFNIEKIKKYEQEIVNAVAVRLDSNYNFSNKLIHHVEGFNIINFLHNKLSDNFYLRKEYKLQELEYYSDIENWTTDYVQSKYEHLVNIVFDNLVVLKEDEKRMSTIQKALAETKTKYIYQYDMSEVNSFYDKTKLVRNTDKYDEDYAIKLSAKKKETLNKYKTDDFLEEEKKNLKKSALYF